MNINWLKTFDRKTLTSEYDICSKCGVVYPSELEVKKCKRINCESTEFYKKRM